MLLTDAHGCKKIRRHLFLGGQEVTGRSDSFSALGRFRKKLEKNDKIWYVRSLAPTLVLI